MLVRLGALLDFLMAVLPARASTTVHAEQKRHGPWLAVQDTGKDLCGDGQSKHSADVNRASAWADSIVSSSSNSWEAPV